MVLKHLVPDEHLKNIGDITVSFALLESSVKTLASSLLGAGQRLGQIVTAELSFKAIRSLTVSLYLQRNGEDEQLGQLRDLIKRAAAAEEKRNKIIHSLWAAGNDEDSITRMKITAKDRHGICFQFENVSVSQLLEFVGEIQMLAQDFQDFWISLSHSGKAYNGYSPIGGF
jgi:hypothetical protein